MENFSPPAAETTAPKQRGRPFPSGSSGNPKGRPKGARNRATVEGGLRTVTSEARLAANRRNAMKSTGPRTPAGKAVVALNGIKHGLLSREVLVRGESEVELVEFEKRLRAQLAPVGELELLLVDRMVSTAWRLRRLVAVETMLFDRDDKPDARLQ